LRRAVRKQKAVVRAFPRCRSSLAFRRLAARAGDWPVSDVSTGHVAFFFEHNVNDYQTLEKVG
jgi:flagellar biosynthesis protein FlhG